MILKRKLEENNKVIKNTCLNVLLHKEILKHKKMTLDSTSAFPLWHKALTTEDSDNVTL